MNGVHDMGGMHGLGPIAHTPKEPAFFQPWEGRVFAMLVSVNGVGHFNTDEFRHAMERMHPVEYMTVSYYEHWLHATETLLQEKGLITAEELAATLAKVKEEYS